MAWIFAILLILVVIGASKNYKELEKLKAAFAKVLKEKDATQKGNETLSEELKICSQKIRDLQKELDSLLPFRDIRDTTIEADRVRRDMAQYIQTVQSHIDEAQTRIDRMITQANHDADQVLSAAKNEASNIRRDARHSAQEQQSKIESLLGDANRQASHILQEAKAQAEKIGGDAYLALEKAGELQERIVAMQNVIDGYGDRYLRPTYSLLDELAETYGHFDAGQQLKLARERARLMVEHASAAGCEYVEPQRRAMAIRFVLDAFNGKTDSIFSRAKVDNFGQLEREIKDAFALVNHNGAAFRNARINPAFLDARLSELKWVTAVYLIREQEKEEQRRIRDQIREEEKARREIERALNESAKEEAMLQKAMEKARQQMERASAEQRTLYEEKLADLQIQLTEAEARNQRALSMAQQTKAGHVYVISNVGSFGENVYKIGMTRRLEPLDRIKELGDASVPFSFDVHAMIWSENAPELEHKLHKHLVMTQINKINPRKEFFRVGLGYLRDYLEQQEIQAAWTMTAHAAEYRESLVLEKVIQDDPKAQEEWLRYQAVQEAIDEVSDEKCLVD
ncbi:MAG: DUF4041 domain-containing protein [Burkholderiales bacterium]|nr:DUF4041 domain-containing protein [Burkholderiales bacterium]